MRRPLLALVCALLFAHSLGAQTFDLEKDRQPIVALDGLWRFHTGDDPRWADPNFDDSHWPLLKSTEDWGQQGYQGYRGMAWYRFRVIVPAAETYRLWLLLPPIVTSSQVFADGQEIGGCGGMPPHPIVCYCKPHVIGLPANFPAGAHPLVIAIRVWHWRGWSRYQGGGPFNGGGALGPFPLMLYIGTSRVVESRLRGYQDFIHVQTTQNFILLLLTTLGALVSFALFYSRRSDREYLWFGCLLLLAGGQQAWFIHLMFHTVRVVSWSVCNLLLESFGWFAVIAFYHVLLQGRRSWPLFAALAGISLSVLSDVLLSMGLAPFLPIGAFVILWSFTLAPAELWVIVLVLQRARQGLVDARLLLAPVLLLCGNLLIGSFVAAAFQLGWQHRYPTPDPQVLSSPFPVNSMALSYFIFLVAMLAILVNRFSRTRREEERMEAEFEAARQVQQVLVPEPLRRVAGFAVAAEYLPRAWLAGISIRCCPRRSAGSSSYWETWQGRGCRPQ